VEESTHATTRVETNPAHEQKAPQEINEPFIAATKSDEVENRPSASTWAWISVAIVILAAFGGWFILHRPKPQAASQVVQQSLPTTASASSATVPAITPAGLTIASLANMNYELAGALSELGDRTSTVKLVDGKGSFGDWNALLDKEHISFGDLNGVGINDAAVVLSFEGPGSAAPQVLIAVTNVNGKGESTAVRALGNNSVVKSVSINGGIVTINMLTVGPNDSMANPETPQLLKLKVNGNKFLPVDGRLVADQASSPDANPAASAFNAGANAVSNADVPNQPNPPKKTTIASGVAAANLLNGIMPTYPYIAKAARVQGTVVLHATISRTGTVKNLTVTDGPPMLRQAALEAVRQWRYKPFEQNGEPVEADTTINVTFSLGG
jgi:TonB family protein